ncbi:MAG: sulfatase-like hydrolase/transferase [Phycisphaerales bacterium]|nr:MAG: sulfatase-like hydrolase/transferase [Phycisphaerales bacterium]
MSRKPAQPEDTPQQKRALRGPSDSTVAAAPRARRRTFAIGIVAVVAAAIVGSAVWRVSHPRPGGSGPGFNVLLITLDTTRADYLGCYGHPGSHTPNIDRLASEGTIFTQCTAAAPSTLPSHTTIMTATYPHVHGVRHNVGYRVGQANLTLTEVLKRAGYRTGAYVAALVVNRDTGLAQGFETYDDAGMRHERRADEVCNGAIGWLRRQANDKFFLWVHFFDPHAPYRPPEPFRTRYQDPYVGEIAFVDKQVGRLLKELSRSGLERKTLVVLTSDHGEGLGQHGEDTHLYFVYDTTMSVPLIFRCPGQIPPGCVVRAQVRNVDIGPTILAFLGMRIESALPDAQGTSLVAHMLSERGGPDLPAYGETLAGQIILGTAALRCLRADGWKCIHAPRPELYDIRRDPSEQNNLAASEPDRLEAMRDQLREILDASPKPLGAGGSAARLDQNTLDQLESLGYVGGDARAVGPAGPELDRFAPVGNDPKDHKEDFLAIGQATEHLQTGRFAEAETVYRRLVSGFPDSANLQMHLARSVFLQGKFEPAIALYRSLLERHPGNARAHYGLGKLLGRVGRRSEAIEQFTLAVRLDPEYAEAHYDLGVALRKDGRGDEAVDCFRRAVQVRPTYVDARVNLGVELAARGKLDEAIEQYRQALRRVPDDAAIHFNLGNALARTGDRPGAIQAYREALRLNPNFAAARRALDLVEQEPGAGESPP